MENLGSFEPHVLLIQAKIARLATQLNRMDQLIRSLNVPIVDLPRATNFSIWISHFICFYADYEQAKEDDEYN